MKRRILILSLLGLLICFAASGTDATPDPNSYLNTVVAFHHPPEPRINGPRITGASPGKPFLFLVPATGQAPLSYRAAGLPKGLTLDPATGIISGSLPQDGVWVVKLTVTNPAGKASRNLNIVGGKNQLALTPPLGWNAWNAYGCLVKAKDISDAADAMVASGLAAHGYQYVNIDDCWMEGPDSGRGQVANVLRYATGIMKRARDVSGVIITKPDFADMSGLAANVHAKGLKLGIYSSPGPQTCARHEGSQGFEAIDARTWAEWGIDYLKYDLCSYSYSKLGFIASQDKKAYQTMGDLLVAQPRDIVFSLCQYGFHDVWKWGPDVHGNLWRTSTDVKDIWHGNEPAFPAGVEWGFSQSDLAPYAGPGHWNDPDMLVVGKLGGDYYEGEQLNSRLTPEEQITHITLWSMMAAPLLIGCDLTQLDDFTLALLTNDEVLDVDQDPLGHAGSRLTRDGKTEVWTRPLWDGAMAVALFNRGPEAAEVSIAWSDLGREGAQPVRDLWLQRDLGRFDSSYRRTVPSHGTVLLKVGGPPREDFSLLEP